MGRSRYVVSADVAPDGKFAVLLFRSTKREPVGRSMNAVFFSGSVVRVLQCQLVTLE